MDHATVETETTSQPLPWKTVLIGVATVAGAIGLFVRYYGCPGLLLGILMLLGGWSYLRGNRSATVTHLTLLLVFWITLQFFGPYTSLRNRVVWIVGTERLQQWAIEVLDNPPPPDEHGRRELDPQDIPEDIRTLAGPFRQRNVVLMHDDDMNQHCIQFGHGGGFYHWGILVGRPGYTPIPSHRYFRIADGIWGFIGG